MTSSRTALQRQSRVSQPWRCAHQQSPVVHSTPTWPLQRRGPPLTSHLFGSTRLRRRILRGRQFKTPCTTAAFGGITFLLPPPAGVSLEKIQGKLWYSVQAVLKVVSAPVRVRERGARCFAGRFTSGRRWKRLQRFLKD